MHLIFVPISIVLSILTAFVGIDGGGIAGSDGDGTAEGRRRKIATMVSLAATVFDGIATDIRTTSRVYEIKLSPGTPLEQVTLQLQDAETKNELPHSLPVAQGLVRYLAAPPPTGYLNCISFVEQILDLGVPLLDWLQTSGWHWAEDPPEEQIRLGDIVLLFSRDDHSHPRHVAVKFAANLYLSKAHPKHAPILLANLELIKSAWQAAQILVIGDRSTS